MRRNRTHRPALEYLEDRCVLAFWPIQLAPGQLPQLLETYGQYQELANVLPFPLEKA